MQPASINKSSAVGYNYRLANLSGIAVDQNATQETILETYNNGTTVRS